MATVNQFGSGCSASGAGGSGYSTLTTPAAAGEGGGAAPSAPEEGAPPTPRQGTFVGREGSAESERARALESQLKDLAASVNDMKAEHVRQLNGHEL